MPNITVVEKSVVENADTALNLGGVDWWELMGPGGLVLAWRGGGGGAVRWSTGEKKFKIVLAFQF